MIMKKHNLAEFLKSKSFYALLCVGALAIITIAAVGLNRTSDNSNQNLVDLNEPISNVADGEGNNSQDIASVPDTNDAASSTPANKEAGSSQTEVAQGKTGSKSESGQAVTDGSLLEYDVVDDGVKLNAKEDLTQSTSEDSVAKNDAGTNNKDSEKSNSDATKAVMKPESLFFKPDKGLLWPVNGNVLMNYSMDRVIYYQTLEQFKCNPAIIIDAEVGTKVLSATKGIITSITNEDETGLTVTASIGSGYSLVYGQLNDVKVEVGDMVKEGDVLGTIAEPSKYYTVEGSNLYFKVLKDKDTVDPMLLLR
jgi:murein DD-endopeptidase MepM/ murein hydrolase activator NlpD